LTEDEDEYIVKDQDDFDSYLKGAKEFLIIMEDEIKEEHGREEGEEDYIKNINIKVNFDITEKEIEAIMNSVKMIEIDNINDDIEFDIEKYKEEINKKYKNKFEIYIKGFANDIKNILLQKINIIKANIIGIQNKNLESIEKETKVVMDNFYKIIDSINNINDQLIKLNNYLKERERNPRKKSDDDCNISDEENGNDNDNNLVKNIAPKIKFELKEIKHEVNIKEAKFFNIDNINILNIGDKEFTSLFFVIDADKSSKNLVFYGNSKNNYSNKLTPNGSLKSNEKLNHSAAFHFNEPIIGEYTIFIYVREKPDGENLSPPLKINVNLTGGNSVIDYKNLDKKMVEEMFNELQEEFNITSVLDKEIVIKKIIEFNCDREKFIKWYEDTI